MFWWPVGIIVCFSPFWVEELRVSIKYLTRPAEEPVNCSEFIFVDEMGGNHTQSLRLIREQALTKIRFHELQMRRQIVSMDRIGKHFFQRNWEPSYSCTALARMGCPGDGGKWVCDPQYFLQQAECVVYSFGSNNEFSFEDAVHHFNPKCEIHTFDPSLSSSEADNTPDFVKFHAWALGRRDSRKELIFTLPTIMRQLGHRRVSVLKVDCEGCELDSFSAGSFPVRKGAIQQILVEVHFDGKPERVHSFFTFLSSSGYAIFSKEANIQYSDGNAVEFSLVYLKDDLGE